MEEANEEMPVLVRGTVTSFDVAKGYGFVAQGGGKELFTDQAVLQRHDPHILGFGAHVVFEVIQGPRGPHVSSVRAF